MLFLSALKKNGFKARKGEIFMRNLCVILCLFCCCWYSLKILDDQWLCLSLSLYFDEDVDDDDDVRFCGDLRFLTTTLSVSSLSLSFSLSAAAAATTSSFSVAFLLSRQSR